MATVLKIKFCSIVYFKRLKSTVRNAASNVRMISKNYSNEENNRCGIGEEVNIRKTTINEQRGKNFLIKIVVYTACPT